MCHTQVPISLGGGGANTELSKVIVMSWVGEIFPGRKTSSVNSYYYIIEYFMFLLICFYKLFS